MIELEKKIALTSGKQKHLIALNEIVFIKASNIYSHVYLANSEVLVVSETITHIEKQINSPFFYRTHRSYFICLHFISTYNKKTLRLQMKYNNCLIPISRDNKKKFELVLNKLFSI